MELQDSFGSYQLRQEQKASVCLFLKTTYEAEEISLNSSKQLLSGAECAKNTALNSRWSVWSSVSC